MILIYFLNMVGNIGGKIKSLAQITTWLGIIVSVIWGFELMTTDEDFIPAGLIASWKITCKYAF